VLKNLKLAAIKKLLLLVLPLLLHVKFSATGGAPGISWPDLADIFSSAQTTAATLLYYYELVSRLVPTLENNSLFHLLGVLLNNLVPNAAVTDDGGKGVHDIQEYVFPKPGAGPGPGLSVI
jgi:hypothetical protein